MTRRVSHSQLRNKLRQLQLKQQQALRQIEAERRKQLQRAKQRRQQAQAAATRFDNAVRTYNARVRANRRALDAAWSRLAVNSRSRPSRTTVTFRNSQTLRQSYMAFSERVDTQQLGPAYNAIADLAEREVANDLIVTNLLFGDPEVATEPVTDSRDADLPGRLQAISPELERRWRGAVFALSPQNPDAVRHFCVSSREIVNAILDYFAPVEAVLAASPNCTKTPSGQPVRRERIMHMLRQKGYDDETLVQMVDDDVASVVALVKTLNDGAHGATDTFGATQFASIRRRVADALNFLSILGAGLQPTAYSTS